MHHPYEFFYLLLKIIVPYPLQIACVNKSEEYCVNVSVVSIVADVCTRLQESFVPNVAVVSDVSDVSVVSADNCIECVEVRAAGGCSICRKQAGYVYIITPGEGKYKKCE
jgi:hypothetical protein